MRCLSRLFPAALLFLIAGGVLSVVHAQNEFITTWQTTSDGDKTVKIGTEDTTPSDYNFTIDWGDGTTETITGTDPRPSHTYPNAGTYTVKIEGTFPQFFARGGSESKLQSIEQWGDIAWESMIQAFRKANNLTYNATDTPDLSGVTNMSEMFRSATSFNGDIGDWDVSGVENMSGMFLGADQFNQDISAWDVSSVTTMNRMFANADRFNQDISGWDVSSVTDMKFMFANDTNAGNDFNQDISGWNVSNVTNMGGMFDGATAFNQDLSSWDVSSVAHLQSGSLGFLANTALSRANYEALLNGWSQLTLQNNVTLDVGTTKYTPSAGPARHTLKDTYGWTINDGGRIALLEITGTDGTGNDAGWRMMSFPQDITLGDIEDNFNFNFQDVASGAVVYSWDDSAESWTPVDTDAATIAAGNGVIIYFFDDSDDPITSSGFSFSVPGTDSPETDFSRSGLDINSRFLMLGNPYLRPYDLSSLDLTTANGFQQTVQVWDPDQDAFVPRDRSMGETVAGMQGFFAERAVKGEGATSLTFSAGGTQGGTLGNFIGKSATDTIQTAPVELALTVTASGGDTLSSDRVTVRYDERAAPGWDAYEATKLPRLEADGFATLTSPIEQAGALTRRRLAAEPFPSGDKATTVPLSARSVDATGTATLRLLGAPDAAGALELTDTDADTTVNLRSTGYTFDLDAGDGQIETPDEARFQLHATSASLPVEWADFSAVYDAQSALLTWETAAEQQNAGFAVQHRGPAEGQEEPERWSRLGFVEGHGTTTNAHSYRFRTDQLAAGTHRFRLKQVDTDGSSSLSESVSVQIGSGDAYSLMAPTPNPTTTDARIRLTVDRTQPVRVAVYDVLGREVGVVFDESLSARTPQTMSMGRGLPAGTYFIRLRGTHFTATERLTIVR